MNEILETLYAKDATPKDPSCKTCKNKPKLYKSGMFWIAMWMMVMAFYGNFILFRQIFNFIF